VSTAGELHVVFGSGPVGLAVVETLLAQGKQIRVASRSGTRRSLPDFVEVMAADATVPADTRRASERSYDEAAATRLWQVSADLVGLTAAATTTSGTARKIDSRTCADG